MPNVESVIQITLCDRNRPFFTGVGASKCQVKRAAMSDCTSVAGKKEREKRLLLMLSAGHSDGNQGGI